VQADRWSVGGFVLETAPSCTEDWWFIQQYQQLAAWELGFLVTVQVVLAEEFLALEIAG
jgi:hypothetical protein